MTDTAERIGKLAERFDPEPPRSMRPDRENPPEWLAWWRRDGQRNTFLAIATPGALLGALMDLLRHARSDELPDMMDDAVREAARLHNGSDYIEQLTAALLAAMEEV